MKNGKMKAFSVLSSATLFTAVAAPAAIVATPAYAAGSGSISASSVPTVKDADHQKMGTILVEVPAGTSISNGDTLIVKLPSDTELGSDFGGLNYLNVPSSYRGESNDLTSGEFTVTGDVYDDQIEIKYTGTDRVLNTDSVLFIVLQDVNVENGTTGVLEASLEAPGDSAFPAGKVAIAKAASDGEVALGVDDTVTSNDDFTFTLTITEDIAGALSEDDESLKIKLPNGYAWDNTAVKSLRTVYGETFAAGTDIVASVDDEELTVAVNKTTAKATQLELVLGFHVDDETDVKEGDIVAKISGDTDTNVSEAVVGKYGDYEASVSAKDTPTLFAGKDEQKIGDIVIKEDVEGTLIQNRTVTLTLPAGARWQPVYDVLTDDDDTNDNSPADLDDFDKENNLQLDFVGFTGTDDRTAKFVVNAPSNDDDTEITLEDVEVALDAEFSGDLEIEVGGSAGLTGTVKVAEVVKPITASAEQAKNVVIGLSNQDAADFTFEEKVAGALEDDKTVVLDLPAGVIFVGTPNVEVTKGDLKISNVRRINGDNAVAIDVDAESSEPSTVKVSGIKLKLDRTVAEGDIALKVQGNAAVETNVLDEWSNSDTAAKAVIAKVATPAPEDQKATASFVIGSTSYTVNGVAKTLDVAPFEQDGRTYLPVRYVADALGVASDNIMYNPADQSVIIIKGDRVIKLQIGSNVMTVNGVSFTMDVPALEKNGRTMLPIRFVAQALGAAVDYDAATQTVTVKQ